MRNHIEIIKDGQNIKIYGNRTMIERAKNFIEKLELSGVESKDRLIIQNCIDENKIGADISYNGNTVYSFNKIVNQFRKLQQNGTLENMSQTMYHFFMYACGDIAHYGISGYRYNYDDSVRRLEESFLQSCSHTKRFTDVDRIFKEIKIGEYFKERQNIDLNKLSLKEIKTLIEQCGWNVNILQDDLWKLDVAINDDLRFCFQLEVSDNKTSEIIYSLFRYCTSFDADEYIEMLIKERGNDLYPPTRFIVKNADNVKFKLSKLASDLLYKSRLKAEIKVDNKKEKNIELELER